MNNVDKKPTRRQLDLIKDLEAEFGEPFTGTTKSAAGAYIDKWLTAGRRDVDRNYSWDNESRNG